MQSKVFKFESRKNIEVLSKTLKMHFQYIIFLPFVDFKLKGLIL